MEIVSISLQMMHPDCKPLYARAYTAPAPLEQKMKQSQDWWTLETLKKTIHLNGLLNF
jgi:hypothetical protein